MKYFITGFIIVGAVLLLQRDTGFTNRDQYDHLIAEASKKYGVPARIIKAVIATESSFRATARAGTTSARGLMQITRGASEDVGYSWQDLDNPAINIEAGTKYLAMQIKRFGLVGGIRAYYEGAGNRIRNSDADPSNDNPQRAKESRRYALKVLQYAIQPSMGV